MDKLELEILRNAQAIAQKKIDDKKIKVERVDEIIEIVENFIIEHKLVCYGGTAINNILPAEEQFYVKDEELPDYDFFSPEALEHTKELIQIYKDRNFTHISAFSGVHPGTFKVIVNTVPVADITQLPENLFKAIQKRAIVENYIYYAPPNYLRMAMFLELSRPAGDVSRWEKVLVRLQLLNEYYPINDNRCDHIKFIRDFEGDKKHVSELYSIVKDSLIKQGLVFFGAFACTLYGDRLPKHMQRQLKEVPDFDVLAIDPLKAANNVATRILEKKKPNGKPMFKKKDVQVIRHDELGEIISTHYEVAVGKDSLCFIYKPLACHSYNTIKRGKQTLKVASIDTMLSFYLAFIYADRPYYDEKRLICMAQYLLDAQAENRLAQDGLLARFSTVCYGKQKTLDDLRDEKAAIFKELKDKRGTPEYEKYFFRYAPSSTKSEPVASKKSKPASTKSEPAPKKSTTKKRGKKTKAKTRRA